MKLNLSGLRIIVFLLIVISYQSGKSQLGSFQTLPLDDLTKFKAQDGNWSIVGDVMMDRTKDIHEHGNSVVSTKPGTGIIVNMNDEVKRSALLTNLEHGDIELELEFMLPKGSNSGVYLQGRYEVQLFDSWGEKRPKFSDLGGIYRNWETKKDAIYMGKEPLMNAAKAPGLWQKMYISFSAPRFDKEGKKVSNAIIHLAKINGSIIHKNIEIPHPTGGPIINNEVAKGPLMIQGDHGPVAIKNIKYRLFSENSVTLGKVSYKYWKGSYEDPEEYKDKKPTRTGESPEGLTWEVTEDKTLFGLELNTTLDITKENIYRFDPIFGGFFTMYVDDSLILKTSGGWEWDKFKSKDIFLTKGTHSMRVFYSRSSSWRDPSLAINISSDNMRPQPIQTLSSYFVKEADMPLLVSARKEPAMLRAFLDYKGDRSLRRTHTIGVGDPSGMNYIWDNDLGAISCIWRGDFVDATSMWIGRGDGSFKPLGDPIYLDNTPQLDVLNTLSAPFSEVYKDGDFRPRGYKINEDVKQPIFQYTYKGMDFTDALYPDALSNTLIRELKVTNADPNAYSRLAHGKSIVKTKDNEYLIDGDYYILSPKDVILRTVSNQQELIAPLKSGSLRYSLVW
jgi:hypothetical protein